MTPTEPFATAYGTNLLERGIRYFFPEFRLTALGSSAQPEGGLAVTLCNDSRMELDWLGIRYELATGGKPFTFDQREMIEAIGRVIYFRFRVVTDLHAGTVGMQLFRGTPEDRYVSAFLEPFSLDKLLGGMQDRVADAIDVLRTTSLSTYENRRIATGVLLYGNAPDPCHRLPASPDGALYYSNELTSIKSFHRLCDGLQTVALVDRAGRLVEIVEVDEWAAPFQDIELPAPAADLYRAHSRATLCGGHIGLILTPNGEIKIFANGVQVFNFLDGRWRLTDAAEKYRTWRCAVGDDALAKLLYHAALNLAEDRRGGLFVVLDDVEQASQLVGPGDLLTSDRLGRPVFEPGRKDQLHYLLRGCRLLDVASPVIESVARIDGAMVLDRESNLLAFGAILRHTAQRSETAVEGGRTNAAISASQFGPVLKVSEDGLVSFYSEGRCVWEM